jgi:hypothetical protein
MQEFAMAIVHQTNKKTGVTYVYESTSYWDKEKQLSPPRRKQQAKKLSSLVPVRFKQPLGASMVQPICLIRSEGSLGLPRISKHVFPTPTSRFSRLPTI